MCKITLTEEELSIVIAAAIKSVKQIVQKPEEPIVKAEQPKQFDTDTYFDKKIEMVLVEGGKFMMGSNDGYDDEKPVHEVKLDSFYISKFPVTNSLWSAVMFEEEKPKEEDRNLPKTNVSWHDTQKFIKRLNAVTGKNYRLPTEAEWEFAARGGNKSKGFKFAGSDDLDKVGWYYKNTNRVMPIGLKKPNELDIHDMSGNVTEWCADSYRNYPKSTQTNPTDLNNTSCRVLRGGSWISNVNRFRVTNREHSSPGFYSNLNGFRLAHDY